MVFKFIASLIIAIVLPTPSYGQSCTYPTSLDSATERSLGYLVTQGDWNELVCAINQLESTVGISSAYNFEYTADGEGIEESSNQFSLELDSTSLVKSASGVAVNLSGSSLAIDGSGLKVNTDGVAVTQLNDGGETTSGGEYVKVHNSGTRFSYSNEVILEGSTSPNPNSDGECMWDTDTPTIVCYSSAFGVPLNLLVTQISNDCPTAPGCSAGVFMYCIDDVDSDLYICNDGTWVLI